MDFWNGELEVARRQIAEIEDKIALRWQEAEQLHARGDNAILHMRLIAIMEESLTRAKTYARQIEKRIAAQRGDTERRRSGRAVLIDALATKHAPSLAPSSMGSP
jgi:thioredoxin-like negative regulator of GroEL